jgi:hypothetical protein
MMIALGACLVLAGFPAAPAAERTGEAACGDGSPDAFLSLWVQYWDEYHIVLGSSGFPITYVYVQVYSVPFQKVRFSIPDPPFGIVVGESWYYAFTGTRAGGMEMDFESCQTGFSTLGYLAIFVPPGTTGSCLPWKIDDGCEIEDCSGVVRAAQPRQQVSSDYTSYGCPEFCWQCCDGALPPHTLLPPDGATGVALDATLSWTLPYPDDTSCSASIRISTDAACGSGDVFQIACLEQAFAPGILEPSTTYYWQVTYTTVYSSCYIGTFSSELQSFTTADPLSTTQTTWGRVKAMYRD